MSESSDGFVVEHGAEGFVAGSQAVPALASDAGIADHLVEQLVQRSFRFDAGQLVELAPGEAARLLGFQVPTDELGRGIRSFFHGMGELPERLMLTLRGRVELRLGSAVERRPAFVRSDADHARCHADEFDAAVVATSARSAAALLGDAFGPSARALRNRRCYPA